VPNVSEIAQAKLSSKSEQSAKAAHVAKLGITYPARSREEIACDILIASEKKSCAECLTALGVAS
jgi:hypothetical protein